MVVEIPSREVQDDAYRSPDKYNLQWRIQERLCS